VSHTSENNARMSLSAIRWAAIAPAVWLAWTVALNFGIAASGLIDRFCPQQFVVSGHHCNAPWYGLAMEGVFAVSGALAASLILMAATFIAPAHKATVAKWTFASGAVVATIMALMLQAWVPLLTTMISGALTAAWLRRRRWAEESTP
jgi:hypothetical protein